MLWRAFCPGLSGLSRECEDELSADPRPTETLAVSLDLLPAFLALRPGCGVMVVVTIENVPAAHGYRLSVRNGGRPSWLSVCSWLSKWESFLPVSFNRSFRLTGKNRSKKI